MERRQRDSVILFVGLLCLITLTESATATMPIGVILDLNSSLDSTVRAYINIALQDFYSTHDSYTTNLALHFRNSTNDLLTVVSAARDLIKNKSVRAIIVGPENSEQARYVVELGTKSGVTVIWFSPSGPSLLPPLSPFSIHSNTTGSLCFQFKAIAAIIEAYGWECVIPIYEMPEFGNDLIPCLTYALQDIDTRVPYISAIQQNFTKEDFDKELEEIKRMRTCVYLAHMSVKLWSSLVEHTKNASMMSEGYAWILTQGLSPVLDSKAKDIKERGCMDGALGVRPSLDVSNTTKLDSLVKNLSNSVKDMSIYGLWAYGTITALAYAAQKNETGLKLEPSQIVIYNIEKDQEESIIGFWSPEKGLQNASEHGGRYKLRDPVWPGNTKERPPKLKIGVPKALFTDFVNVIGEGNSTSATGFTVEMFKKVVGVLPFPLPYRFVCVDNTNGYDDLLRGFSNKSVDVDVIIGDITTTGNRTDWIDFTMPYLDSSVSMVVKVMSDSSSPWILFKPFHWSLWLILGGIFVGATVIIILLEKRNENKQPTTSEEANSNEKTEDDVGGSKFKDFARNPLLIYTSDVHRLQNGTSKWVVIVVTFFMGLVVQVYTANLTSILTEMTTAKPSPWRDMEEIRRNSGTVGYQKNSWVKDILIKQMRFEENRTKPLGNLRDYENALRNGSEKDGVDAIFDETPYLMLLLSKCPSYKMTGPIYKAGGFAFAFPNNSILVSRFTAAIVEMTTQDVETFHNMTKDIYSAVTIDKSEYKSKVETRSLTPSDFGGLFLMALFVLVLFFSISILKIPSITNCVPYIAHLLHKKLVSACTL